MKGSFSFKLLTENVGETLAKANRWMLEPRNYDIEIENDLCISYRAKYQSAAV